MLQMLWWIAAEAVETHIDNMYMPVATHVPYKHQGVVFT
jgi:hypothetical protein